MFGSLLTMIAVRIVVLKEIHVRQKKMMTKVARISNVGKRTLHLKFIFTLLCLMINMAIMLRVMNVDASNAGRLNSYDITPDAATPVPCKTSVTYNLWYFCGPVMHGPVQVNIIYWEPNGYTSSVTYKALLLRFYQDVGRGGFICSPC